MHLTDIIALIALGFCAAIGAGALFAPKWAADIVRLVADPSPDRPGGFSEFRATYGGLLFMLHFSAFMVVLQPGLEPTVKLFTLFPIAAAWIGAGTGRTMSWLLDGEQNRSAGRIPIWIPLEIALGLAVMAPLLQLL